MKTGSFQFFNRTYQFKHFQEANEVEVLVFGLDLSKKPYIILKRKEGWQYPTGEKPTALAKAALEAAT